MNESVNQLINASSFCIGLNKQELLDEIENNMRVLVGGVVVVSNAVFKSLLKKKRSVTFPGFFTRTNAFAIQFDVKNVLNRQPYIYITATITYIFFYDIIY